MLLKIPAVPLSILPVLLNIVLKKPSLLFILEADFSFTTSLIVDLSKTLSFFSNTTITSSAAGFATGSITFTIFCLSATFSFTATCATSAFGILVPS